MLTTVLLPENPPFGTIRTGGATPAWEDKRRPATVYVGVSAVKDSQGEIIDVIVPEKSPVDDRYAERAQKDYIDALYRERLISKLKGVQSEILFLQLEQQELQRLWREAEDDLLLLLLED